jgi:hypothetical protein
LYNTIQRHSSNSESNFFLASDRLIGRNPPTVQEVQRQLQLKDTCYINMLRYFAQNIKGSNSYWHSRSDNLEQWINHHVSRGHGPPTFFITFSCAKNWWSDLRGLQYQLEKLGGNAKKLKQSRTEVGKKCLMLQENIPCL